MNKGEELEKKLRENEKNTTSKNILEIMKKMNIHTMKIQRKNILKKMKMIMKNQIMKI